MQLIRVEENWQRAAVYYLRVKVNSLGLQIPLNIEFDPHDGEETKYVLLLDGNTPVATARLYQIDERTLKIVRVCVAQEYQGKGLGHEIVSAAEGWAEHLGAEKIIITSKSDVVGFYEKLGYVPDFEKKYDSFIPIVYTEKTSGGLIKCLRRFKRKHFKMETLPHLSLLVKLAKLVPLSGRKTDLPHLLEPVKMSFLPKPEDTDFFGLQFALGHTAL